MSAQDGFLSDEASASIPITRSQFQPWFDDYAQLNRVAMTAMAHYGPTQPAELNRSYSLALFVRCMQNLQGSCLLLERSMTTEARILLRSATEAAIILTALVADPQYTQKLTNRTEYYARKIATEFLTEPLKSRAPQQSSAEYQKVLNDLNAKYPAGFPHKGDPVNVADAAKCNQVAQELYSTVFRVSSSDSTHISSGSLKSQFRQTSRGTAIAIGPDNGGILSTLSQMFVVLWLAIDQIQKSKGVDHAQAGHHPHSLPMGRARVPLRVDMRQASFCSISFSGNGRTWNVLLSSEDHFFSASMFQDRKQPPV